MMMTSKLRDRSTS